MILSSLSDAELGQWCRAWAEKWCPRNGNLQKVIFALCDRLESRLDGRVPPHRPGPTE